MTRVFFTEISYMTFSVVRLTLTLTGIFLLYYAVYGTFMMLSTDCSKDTKGNPKKEPVEKTKIAISLFIAVCGALLMLYFSHSIGESWEEAEESMANAPFYSSSQWEHSAEAATWAVHSVRYVIAAAIIFPVVIIWMRKNTLGPLDTCQKEKDSFMAQTRDALASLEPGLYIVMALLAGALLLSIRNWRAYRSADKAAQAPPDDPRSNTDKLVDQINATRQKASDIRANYGKVRDALMPNRAAARGYTRAASAMHEEPISTSYSAPDVPVNRQSASSSHSSRADPPVLAAASPAPVVHPVAALDRLRSGHTVVAPSVHGHSSANHKAMPRVVDASHSARFSQSRR